MSWSDMSQVSSSGELSCISTNVTPLGRSSRFIIVCHAVIFLHHAVQLCYMIKITLTVLVEYCYA